MEDETCEFTLKGQKLVRQGRGQQKSWEGRRLEGTAWVKAQTCEGTQHTKRRETTNARGF